MKQLVRWSEAHWWVYVLATGVLIFGLITVLARGQSVWFDEGYSILLAKRSVSDLLALTAVDAHPPLYYLLLKVWGELFGFSAIALRSLSAVCASFAAMGGLLLVRRLFGSRVMLMSLPFVLLAPFTLRYGYEIRMYALASLIGVAASYVVVRAQASARWQWWLLYAVLVALGMYTLYMTVALWLAHTVWLLHDSLKAKKRTPWWTWHWLYSFVGAVVLFSPYLPTFFYQLLHSALPGIGKQVTLTEVVDAITMSGLYTPQWGMGGWASLGLGVVLVLIGVAALRTRRQATAIQRRGLQFLGWLVLIPFIFFALSSLPPRQPMYVIRYIAPVVIYLYLWVGVVVSLYWLRGNKGAPRWTAPVLYGGTVVLMLVGVVTLNSAGNFNFERMQQPYSAELRQAVACNDEVTVVADDPYTYIDNAFYFDDCQLTFYSPEEVAMAGGYAPLHASTARIALGDEVTSKRLVHLRWVGADPSFTVPEDYGLIETVTLDKQIADTYELIEE